MYVNMKKNVIPNYLVGQITGNILYLLESHFPADIQRKQTGAWGQDQADWALHSNPTTAPSEGKGYSVSLPLCIFLRERFDFVIHSFYLCVYSTWWMERRWPTCFRSLSTLILISTPPVDRRRWETDKQVWLVLGEKKTVLKWIKTSYTTPVKNYWQNFDNGD